MLLSLCRLKCIVNQAQMGTANHLKLGTLSTMREDIRLRRDILMKREMAQIGSTPTADTPKIDTRKAGIWKTGILIAALLKAVTLKIGILKAGFQKAGILNTDILKVGILKAGTLKVVSLKAVSLKIGILNIDHLRIGTQPISTLLSIIDILQKDQIDIGLLHTHQKEVMIQQTIAALSINKDTWNVIRMYI